MVISIQNFGILCAFGIGFFTCLLVFTEYNTGTSSEKAVVLFKRGTKPPILKEVEAAVGDDEEKKDTSTTTTATGVQAVDPVKDEEKVKQALEEQPKMTNVFSWDHLNYAVKTGGGEYRKLLDDVSGFVAPGKLTALMGESGAGKVSSVVMVMKLEAVDTAFRPPCLMYSPSGQTVALLRATGSSMARPCHQTSSHRRGTVSRWILMLGTPLSGKRSYSLLVYVSPFRSPLRRRTHSECPHGER
jgi:hypothetical protein